MGYKRGPQWGSSTAAAISTAKQLARVDLAEPRDLTVYLYGWNTPDGSNNTAGFYNVTIGAGGVATVLPRVVTPARGRALHFVSRALQVDADPPGFALPAGTLAKAHVGLGRPTEYILSNAIVAAGGGVSLPVTLPPFVVSVAIVGKFASGAAPHGPASADVEVQVAQANDPLFATPIRYLLSALSNGEIPIDQSSGFWRLSCPTTGALVNYEVKTIS